MNLKLATVLIALSLPLAGCGNKGPLVQAEAPAPVEGRRAHPGEVPVEIAPDPTTAEPEPADAPPTELPIDPATLPDSEADIAPDDTAPAPPVDPPTDDDVDG